MIPSKIGREYVPTEASAKNNFAALALLFGLDLTDMKEHSPPGRRPYGLLDARFSQAEIAAILGGNGLRLLFRRSPMPK